MKKLFLRNRSRLPELIGSLAVAIICRLYAMFMNQSSINCGYQEELSSTVGPIAVDDQQVLARLVGRPTRHFFPKLLLRLKLLCLSA
jgi:hypothetical protein